MTTTTRAPAARLLVPLTLLLAGLTCFIMLLVPKAERTHAFDTAGHPTLGSPAARAEIVLFVDYQCPACRAFETSVLPRVEQDLVRTGQARVVTLQSPFIGPDSRTAANAALCAYRQGNAAFWRLNAALFAQQGDERTHWATPAVLREVAAAQGLDRRAFDACLTSGNTDAQVQADLDQHTRAGFQGTPAVFVNGVRSAPGLAAIRAAVEHARP